MNSWSPLPPPHKIPNVNPCLSVKQNTGIKTNELQLYGRYADYTHCSWSCYVDKSMTPELVYWMSFEKPKTCSKLTSSTLSREACSLGRAEWERVLIPWDDRNQLWRTWCSVKRYKSNITRIKISLTKFGWSKWQATCKYNIEIRKQFDYMNIVHAPKSTFSKTWILHPHIISLKEHMCSLLWKYPNQKELHGELM